MTEQKVKYISGAVMKAETKGDITEVELYAHPGVTYFCKKSLRIKTGAAFKFGIVNTATKNRYEIVSIEQQIMKDPAFIRENEKGEKTATMPFSNFRELINGKHIKIRAEALKAAIEICKHTSSTNNTETFARNVRNIALSLEPYFE